jgi:hypothetical protein
MQLKGDIHFTYCSNIHSGESWSETFAELKFHLPNVKAGISDQMPMGVGLRLSAKAASELKDRANLTAFKYWLDEQGLYVFTINGFPYGGFHFTRVKDQVHAPDWLHDDRIQYTFDLIEILAELLPKGLEGSISTSPLSYKPWFKHDSDKIDEVKTQATENIVKVAVKLYNLEKAEGILIHLNLEPEPDGFLENTADVTDFYVNYVFTVGCNVFAAGIAGISKQESKDALLRYIRICYDVCHFALAWEKVDFVLSEFSKLGIQVGKIQISAALEADISQESNRSIVLEDLFQFIEPTYLHQVSLTKDSQKPFLQIDDLEQTNPFEIINSQAQKARVHFHVPVFVEKYKNLSSTQADIVEVLYYLKSNTFCKHWEVETYTWNVLPTNLQKDIDQSIIREMEWVLEQWEKG